MSDRRYQDREQHRYTLDEDFKDMIENDPALRRFLLEQEINRRHKHNIKEALKYIGVMLLISAIGLLMLLAMAYK